MKEHSARTYKIYEADEDAVYEAEYTIDLSESEAYHCIPTSSGEYEDYCIRSQSLW